MSEIKPVAVRAYRGDAVYCQGGLNEWPQQPARFEIRLPNGTWRPVCERHLLTMIEDRT